MNSQNRLPRSFYTRDVLVLAPDLIGREIIIAGKSGIPSSYIITETEAYRGEEDKACHASKGRTKRTEAMYSDGGILYVYFIYGMYWMLNIVASQEEDPQAVLIRGFRGITGPGRVTRSAGIDGSYYGEDLTSSTRIWLTEKKLQLEYVSLPRIGIDYAGYPWVDKPWRFMAL